MDKASLLDLFDYTGWVWDQIQAAVPDDQTLVVVAPGSGWPALRNCLGHMILAYDRWVPAIVTLKTGLMAQVADGDFRAWPQLDAERARTREALRAAIDRWTEAELQQVHEVNVDGSPVKYSRAELILHLLLHERGHHGDVTTLFWQLGIEAETAFEYRFHLSRD
ncbi:MAG: DinB family protein [Dehalococcoidia bacterium]